MLTSSSLRRLARFATSGSFASRELRSYRAFLDATEGYARAFFNMTVDFELAWSIARRGGGSTSLAQSLERSRRAREQLPALLQLCEAFSLPLTVAVVGHLALADCSHRQPPRFAPSWVPAGWYAVDPHEDLTTNRDYYGADLVRAIRDSVAGHEIASHGFTHVDLGDPETPGDVARFELSESYRLLKEVDPLLSTLVFPQNRSGFLELVREAGYTIYRADRDGRIERTELGLWRFPRGLWFSPRSLSIRDILGLADQAIRRKQLVNCYFHLYEFETPDELERFIVPVFRFLSEQRESGNIHVDTMRGIIDAVARG